MEPGSMARRGARWCLLGSLLALSVPAWAGRDAAQMIAQAKANEDVIARRRAAADEAASAPPTTREAHALDHGPRAGTTPWLDAQRRGRDRPIAAGAPVVDALATPATPTTK